MILEQPDQMVTELEEICKSRMVTPITFFHAQMKEANLGMDRIPVVDFPVLVHIATTSNKIKIIENGNMIRTAKMVCLMLTAKPSIDSAAYDVNQEINRMKQLAENLIYWINRSTHSINGGVNEFELDNIYQKFDADLMGVALTFDWTFDTGKTGY